MVCPHWGSSLLARQLNVTQLDRWFPVTEEVAIVFPDNLKLQNVNYYFSPALLYSGPMTWWETAKVI